MKAKDVLIIARPDHSLQIYNALLKQENITYDYVTFKCVRPWVKSLFKQSKKIVAVGNNAHISYFMTAINILKFKFRFSIFKNLKEVNRLSLLAKCILKRNSYRILHYWPLYCHKLIEKYVNENNNAIAIADVYFPNPLFLDKMMADLYAKYKLNYNDSFFKEILDTDYDVLKHAPEILVPSRYVADTYRAIFPDKKFHIVGYGITISSTYTVKYKSTVSRFVYAGGAISIEKGCDVLCDYFALHPDLEVHLYGTILEHQLKICQSYYKYANIHFHGHFPKSVLQEEISKYDVGIHLSRFDAYSLSVGEMVGVGLPVVVSDQTGIADDVIEYQWGLVTSLEYDDIDRTISKITNTEIYNLYIDNIDYYIRNKHKTYAQRMMDFYTMLLDRIDTTTI